MAGGKRAKGIIKRSIKSAVAMTSPLTSFGHHAAGRILTYHNVGQRDHEMNVTPSDFEKQMEWLSRHIPVLPVSDIAAGAPGVAITFDDGYQDNVLHAAPVLKKYGFSATVFVVAGCIGEHLDGESNSDETLIMTPRELDDWHEAGLEVGAHTMSHRRLSTLRLDEQEFEIGESKLVLEKAIGRPVTSFAYPYGSALDYNTDSVACVERAGYTQAFTNRYGIINGEDGPWTFRRIWIDRSDTLDSFKQKVTGRLDGLSILDSAPGIVGRRVMNRILGTQ